ncbi:hypothetical protein BH24ACT3_BH24ACT3_06180 [soil metagenome]
MLRRTTRVATIATLGLLGAFGAACGDGEPGGAGTDRPSVQEPSDRPPDRPADLVGTVIEVHRGEPVTTGCVPPADQPPDGVMSSDDPPACSDPGAGATTTILVRADPVGSLGDQVSVSVAADATVLRATGDRFVPADVDALAADGTVEVWITGEVLESYPVQVRAVAVVLTAN